MAGKDPPPSTFDEDDDTCECKTCRFFWGLDLPAANSAPYDELILTVRSTSGQIFRTWVELHIILKRFEGVIRKRWSKKSRQQRASILSEAWPTSLPVTSRPDFASVRRGCSTHAKRQDKATQREIHLWPFINLENLVAADTFTAYVNARGRYLPWRFVHTDLSTAHTEKPVANATVDTHRLRVIGCSTPSAYGAPILAHSDECQPGYGNVKAAKIALHPYNAALVFEIQARILNFLRDCSRIILRDHCLANLEIMPSTTQSSAPPLPYTVRPTIELAAAAPYQPPRDVDVGLLNDLIQSRTAEAADNLWALREDPGYFKHQLLTWAEHDSSNIPDKHRQPHECVGETVFWECAAGDMISHAYTNHNLWYNAGVHCDGLRQTLGKYGHDGGQKDRAAVALSFRRFDAHMQALLQWPLFELGRGFCASPPLRSGYIRPQGSCSPLMPELSTRSYNMGQREKRLDTLFRCLLRYDQHKLHGLSGIVEEVQRAFDVEGVRELITSWVADRFSDVALIVEIIRQINSFQPWADLYRGGTKDIDVLTTEEPYCCITSNDEFIKNLIVDCQDLYGPSARELLVSNYPCDKRPSLKSITDMNVAEILLDRFWASFDKSLKAEGGRMWKVLVQPWASPGRKLQRTPRWEQHPCYTPARPVQDSPCQSDIGRMIPRTSILADIDPNGRFARPTRAMLMTPAPTRTDKVKTKGLATPVTPSPLARNSSPMTISKGREKIEPIFHLNKRAFKVFAIILDNNAHPVAADVVWHELLYAMGCLGFATEKLFGSSWRFTPPEGFRDVRDNASKTDSPNLHPIQFHEPHPSSKLRYWEAKRIGRRLARHYGWCGDMFAIK